MIFNFKKPIQFPGIVSNVNNMLGAGLSHRGKKYTTHTTLAYSESAFITFSKRQIIFILAIIGLSIAAFVFVPLRMAQFIVTFLSIFYFIDTIFHLHLVVRSLREPIAISFDKDELASLGDDLPIYSILCPLYKEARIIPQFLNSISKLDWPENKLDVMLILEEDDTETIDAVGQMQLPNYVRVLVVPNSLPKTKPKACNFALAYARGEYLVIYDAEDVPDTLQLKKAYLGFRKLPSNVRCLQAKLNYYNPSQNLLTRLFTAEYSLWFDLTLTGLQSINSTIPLGGTSNHFRTRDLQELKGWDAFNVTEDADLGIRLFKNGYKTAIIDSSTLEEANSSVRNWLRQRSRWIKGYMQTYLVHMRQFFKFAKENGITHAIIFQLTIGGKLLFLLVNPFMWLVTLSYFVFYNHTSELIEVVFYPPISYIAVFSWIFGNFLFIYYYMLACGKRKQWGLIKFVFFIPLYWAIMSMAGGIALYQLIFKPHYWEKTVHGLHLGAEKAKSVSRKEMAIPAFEPQRAPVVKVDFVPKMPNLGYMKSIFVGLYFALFLMTDVLLVNLFYPFFASETYNHISLIGKGIFIGSQLFGIGAYLLFKKMHVLIEEKREISYQIFSTFIAGWMGMVIYIFTTNPFFSDLTLPFYFIAMIGFAMGNVFILYNLRRNIFTPLIFAFLFLSLQVATVFYLRDNMLQLSQATFFLGISYLLFVFILHVNKSYLGIFERNLKDLFGLIKEDSTRKSWEENSLRILIFNWRDSRHRYAGGAEVYVQELAKRWVKQGNKVTLFCGNDSWHASNEIVDGIEVFRRGGTYTVYFFALIYYLFKFSGKYDVIIDCENGIPFFTPLYAREPIVLVIHHVHQEVIRRYLGFPLNVFASFLEGRLMPFLYRAKKIVTVSESSKEEINKLGFLKKDNINIVHNGIDIERVFSFAKTSYPSFAYIGRLQSYKNIDVALKAFAGLLVNYPTARLTIAGFGECGVSLRKIAGDLGILNNVDFLGKVSAADKIRVLSESWACLQPSQVEGWGITVIEANACGTPVIASRVCGLRDSVVDLKTGILVNPRDVEGFRVAMTQMVEDYSFRTILSQNAFEWSRNFDWDKSAEEFYELIGESLPQVSSKSFPAYEGVGV